MSGDPQQYGTDSPGPQPYGSGPPGQQPYPQAGYPVPPTNTMAILALVFAFVFAPLGIVFGIIGRRQIDRTGEGGRGLATAGLVVGIVFTVMAVLYIVLVIVAFGILVTNTP
ncbi:MAG TPA: DUF4190 domain-containing protein [Pseudonocardiaceae bacterium]|jgi:hypothetical protein|nr:DUF4190 domain-containing protein [Pseudonocardiaceae bacterium]